ncbi:hypothetical protein EVAR_63852_1 [Eumeta japonica]|uniref:Uncharacterized protein n=1 Tax=Eumeta variegata TaxID=151549 RepID=A0A4C1Z4S7_EUMVA|nr:hypothetical protein EVAR_63852_1 [Eumeta japonica]
MSLSFVSLSCMSLCCTPLWCILLWYVNTVNVDEIVFMAPLCYLGINPLLQNKRLAKSVADHTHYGAISRCIGGAARRRRAPDKSFGRADNLIAPTILMANPIKVDPGGARTPPATAHGGGAAFF